MNKIKTKFKNLNSEFSTMISKLNEQGWKGWLKFTGYATLILTIVLMFFLAFGYAMHSISGNDWDGWYEGNDKNYWYHDLSVQTLFDDMPASGGKHGFTVYDGTTVLKTKADIANALSAGKALTWVEGNVGGSVTKTAHEWPVGYADINQGWFALMLISIIGSVVAIVFLGAWLSGARWMNPMNPRVSGVPYKRTRLQEVTFRAITLLFGILLLTSFTLEVTGDVLKNNVSSSTIPSAYIGYFTGLAPSKDTARFGANIGNYYYQCFLSSAFIGFALVFKKYNWMPVLLPMAFIGSVRTFIDPKGDWGEDGSWTSFYFHRFMYIHIAIVILPIFVMVANRQHYTLNKVFITLFYTFMMVFVAYMIYALSGFKNNGVPRMESWGELGGIATVFGLKDGTFTGEAYVAHNLHHFFWLIFVPFGLGLTAFIIGTTNAFFYGISKDRKIEWRRSVATVKYSRFYRRLSNFGGQEKAAKTLRVKFGSDVMNLPKGKYIIQNDIAYLVTKEKDFDLVNFEVKK